MNPMVVKMLEFASHPQTSEQEALVAVQKMRQLVDRLGGISRVFQSNTNHREASPPPFVPYSEQQKKIIALETQNAEQSALIVTLREDVSRLVREASSLRQQVDALQFSGISKMKVNRDGTMTYGEFSQQAGQRLATFRDWQYRFEDQTGLPRHRFPGFRVKNEVSAEYVAALSRLTAVVPIPKHKHRWTIEEVNRLRQMTQEGISEKVIAKTLTEEFGRIITENALKRMKLDSRNNKGVFANASYGTAIGKSRDERTNN